MHRKKPRKPVTPQAAVTEEHPLSRRIPPPPPSGFSRVAVIFAVHAACALVISVVGVSMATAMAWIIKGSPISSAPGFFIYVIGMVAFLWPTLYVISELDRWRKRGRAVYDKRS
jgi:hypothetical protein